MEPIKNSPDQLPDTSEKLAFRIVMYCLKKQNHLAVFLGRKFEALTPWQKKVVLVIYISLITSLPITIIFRALTQ